MRKLKTLLACTFVAATLMALSSCSKDDNDSKIIGKWKCTVDNFIDNDGIGHDSFVGEIWEFKDGGVLDAGGDMTSYSVSGESITIMGGMLYGSITELTSSKLVLDLKWGITMGDTPVEEHIVFSKM